MAEMGPNPSRSHQAIISAGVQLRASGRVGCGDWLLSLEATEVFRDSISWFVAVVGVDGVGVEVVGVDVVGVEVVDVDGVSFDGPALFASSSAIFLLNRSFSSSMAIKRASSAFSSSFSFLWAEAPFC